MNHGLWKQIACGLLVLVIGSIALLRVEVLSVLLHAPNPHTDDGGVSVMLTGSSSKSTLSSTSTCTGGTVSFRNDGGSDRGGVRITHVANMTISPGELPGYTGWSRTASTLAHFFDIIHYSSSAPVMGQNWTVTLRCRHPRGRSGGAHFYVRAYGPSVLPGRVTDRRNGTYDFTILPFDAGVYHMEVVVVFSLPPAWESFPVDRPPGYEGYLLPGFPIELDVGAATLSTPSSSGTGRSKFSRLCNMSELMETSTSSAVETGRWKVIKKNVDLPYRGYREPTFKGYKTGENSVGIQMEYVSVHDCEILTQEEAFNEDTLFAVLNITSLKPKPIHVVLVGDSNIRMQLDPGRSLFGGHLNLTLVITNGGLVDRLPAIQAELQDLAREDKHFIVIFNSGLHDVANLCIPNETFSSNFSCGDHYRKKLQELVDVINDFPALLRVWQTTTAAWPKWGIFGNAWTPKSPQRLPKAPNMCDYFNEIAWSVMRENNIPVQDTYWLTLARPDHRQVDEENKVSNHLMHAGPEVYSILVRKWAMMILEVFRSHARVPVPVHWR
jgi:hypothetical protein